MKSIHVLGRIDSPDHGVGIDLLWQRHLHQYPVNGRIGVERIYADEQVGLGDLSWQADIQTVHPRFCGRLGFCARVNDAGGIFSDEYHCQAGLDSPSGELRRPCRRVRADFFRYRAPIDQISGQSPLLSSP